MILIMDIGTSSTRGILFDKNGKEKWMDQIQYQPTYFASVYVEQDPQDWINAVCECVSRAQQFASKNKQSIRAVAFTAQRSSLIPSDENGDPLRSAIMWQDRRNADIVKELSKQNSWITSKTGARINTVYAAAKMTWLKRNEPAIYEKTYKLCSVADFIIHEMTGEFVTDETYACRSLLADVHTCHPDDKLCEYFEVDKEKISTAMEPGSIVGYTTDQFFNKTKLPSGTPVISCGGDQQCSALGMGLVESGSVVITTGTGAFIMAYADHVPDVLDGQIVVERHALKRTWAYECSIPACAALYNWANQIFFSKTQKEMADINAAVMESKPGANDIIVVPSFTGRGTPDWNTSAKGAFVNLTLGSTKQDMARAVIESIACEIANNMETLSNYMNIPETILLTGGMTRFSTFDQILADTLGKKMKLIPAIIDPTALGAWINASVCLKDYADAKEAFQKAVADYEIIEYQPDYDNYAIYKGKRLQMKEIYESLYGKERGY